MSRKSLPYLRFREMFLSVTGVADGAFNVLQQGSQDRVTPAAVGVRKGTSDWWVLVAGFGAFRSGAYPQDAMGVPNQPLAESTVDSAVGLPQDFVFDCTRYWGVDAADRIGYAFDTSFNRKETEEIDTTSQTVNPIAIAWTNWLCMIWGLLSISYYSSELSLNPSLSLIPFRYSSFGSWIVLFKSLILQRSELGVS